MLEAKKKELLKNREALQKKINELTVKIERDAKAEKDG